MLRQHWRDVENRGVSWSDLCRFIASLPDGQLWRYAVVGDLPGIGEHIDELKLGELVLANRGKHGFTFTHKHSEQAIRAARDATGQGLTVNLSADYLNQADLFAEQQMRTVVVLGLDAPHRFKTMDGRTVVKCPATYMTDVDCSRCGLCSKAQPNRPIVGFPAHGLRKREVSERTVEQNRRTLP